MVGLTRLQIWIEAQLFFTFSATQADAQKRLQHVKEQKEAQIQLEEVGYFKSHVTKTSITFVLC